MNLARSIGSDSGFADSTNAVSAQWPSSTQQTHVEAVEQTGFMDETEDKFCIATNSALAVQIDGHQPEPAQHSLPRNHSHL